MTFRRYLWPLAFTPALALAAPVDPSFTMSQQGYLLDAQDKPVTEPHNITVKLWASGTSSLSRDLLWTDSFQQVPFFAGRYSVVLGAEDHKPLTRSAVTGNEVYVGITVDDGTEMLPRLKLNSAPNAVVAQLAHDLDCVGCITKTHIASVDGSTVESGTMSWDALEALVAPRKIANLDADLLDGKTAADFALAGHTHPASDITGVISANQLDFIPAAKITGPILPTQLDAIPAAKITGPILATQLENIPAAKISGTLQAAQIESLPATKITGLVQASQLDVIPATKISGTLAVTQVPNIPTSKVDGLASAIDTEIAAVGAKVKVVTSLPTCDNNALGTIVQLQGANMYGCVATGWARMSTALGLGTTQGNAAASCKAIKASSWDAASGFYWITPVSGGNAVQIYCDMSTGGGGWSLVMQASSTSAFTYGNAVWTATTAADQTALTSPALDQDIVSPAFYTLKGTESMLCMGDVFHCTAWAHASDTARNLANGTKPVGSQAAWGYTDGFKSGVNTLPNTIREAAGGTGSNAWHRWGYVNDNNAWGCNVRVGFSGDGDASDSADTVIGLGLNVVAGSSCASNFSGLLHNRGAGSYRYQWGGQPAAAAPLRAWLFVR